jgi:hypothetical protein
MQSVVIVNKAGIDRVLRGEPGMTFVVDEFTNGVLGPVAHVRDYRFPPSQLKAKPFQIWSIPFDGYEVVKR